MKLDIRTVPFSAYGSYFVISHLPVKGDREEGLFVRLIRGGDSDIGAVFRIEALHGEQSVPFQVEATPALLRLTTDRGYAEWCIAEPEVLRVRANGIGLRFALVPGAYDYAAPIGERGWEVNSFGHERRFMFTPLQGTLQADSAWDGLHSRKIDVLGTPDAATGELELAIEEYRVVPRFKDHAPFDECVKFVRSMFDNWLNQTLPVPSQYEQARTLAAYITWSCVVRQDGNLPRPAMYMSNNWMTNIWSWDHCFNAIALAGNMPETAWDQFMIFFDKQDVSGMLPDFMNDKFSLWNCCKPPIHGWTLMRMMERTEWLTESQLREVYGPLARWTEWWFAHRDDDGDGVPQYNHGNDSGWDNSTVFRNAIPVESPDLSVFLILQMDALAAIAEKLGMPDEARSWRARGDETFDRMLAHFWKGERFSAMQSGTHAEAAGDSLILFMPILLGTRLPDDIRTHLLAGLKYENRFLTPHGLATESVQSEFYKSDGYWRGPIWAPSTYLLYEGLKAAGEPAFARDVARRFCDMAAKSGMAENFDALTGEGLRDPAFTWTSSVFLLLANELLEEAAK